MDKIDKIKERFETITTEQGCELAELNGTRLGGHMVIRAFIHKPGGITLDDCTRVARACSDFLDIENPIQGQYQLEVSSLGLDRPLVKPADFNRRVGEEIKLEFDPKKSPKRRVRGKLVKTDDNGVTLEIDDEEQYFAYDQIVRGKILY